MRHVEVTIYEYMELVGWERDEARRNMACYFDKAMSDVTDEEIVKVCEEYEIEFTEEGLIW